MSGGRMAAAHSAWPWSCWSHERQGALQPLLLQGLTQLKGFILLGTEYLGSLLRPQVASCTEAVRKDCSVAGAPHALLRLSDVTGATWA